MQERFTVAGLLRAQSSERPGAAMLAERGEVRTWADQLARAGQVADALRAEGVAPGDRVAVLDRNGLAYFDLLFGAAVMGAVNVAVNWRLAPLEMEAIIEDARASVLVVHADYLAQVGASDGGLPRVERVVVLGADDTWMPSGRQVSYEQWLVARHGSDPGHVGAPDDVVMQLYTSGTTGLPKGVMLTNHNLSTAVGSADATLGIDEHTVSLVAMPLFHIGGSGWALSAMSRGGRSVILRDMDPVELLRLIEHERVTEMFVVPAVLMMLLATPTVRQADLSSLRTVFYGASPIAEDVLVRCLEVFGCHFTQLYGMTETTGAICSLPWADHDPEGPRRRLLRSAGRPLPGVELTVVDPATGGPAPPEAVGEVLTRSPYNMLGYWERPEETRLTIDEDGWLHTGDAGFLDEDGYLFLHDRINDMIITGGENVYPAEVENALLAHPSVADAAVIGVPDDRWGETVKAIVVPAPGAPAATAEELITHCRARLAHYKCPTSVEIAEALPRNPSGKVLKRVLRAPYWAGHDRAIG